MAVQPLIQRTEPPRQFGELLAEAPTRLSEHNSVAVQEFQRFINGAATKSRRRSNPPIQVTELVSRFERDVSDSEQLVDFGLVGFVKFVRDAGQDDDAARRFDDWTDDLDLAQAFAAYEEKVVPGLKERATILRKVVKGWKRRARAGEIEPDLPPKLARRVKRLDTRINRLTRQITKREDNELIARLLIRVGNHRPLSGAEKIRLSDAVRMKVKFKTEPSVRRADWYGADGR
ncbi:MAG: hypothetical protein OXI78_00955 [Anaerolineaceae bacterium]|nr:hypothetical protein [Anaerolineaceae bacterium]